MNNRKHPDQDSNYRTEDPGRYEEQVTGIEWHGHEILFGLMYEFIKPEETILDIGIGTGLSSYLFHKAGLLVSGFDKSAEMLEECKRKEYKGKIIQHDLMNIPFPYDGASFDNIISMAVLNFFRDPLPVFSEAARIIKPNGIFGFSLERKKPEHESKYTISIPAEENTGNPFKVIMHRHNDEEIRSALNNFGFSIKKSHEFLADQYPDQGIEVYLNIYIANKHE